MCAQSGNRIILISVVDDGTVVAGKDHQRIAGKIQSIEGAQNLSADQSASTMASPRGPMLVFPAKRGCGTRGTCGIVRGEIQKEWPVCGVTR